MPSDVTPAHKGTAAALCFECGGWPALSRRTVDFEMRNFCRSHALVQEEVLPPPVVVTEKKLPEIHTIELPEEKPAPSGFFPSVLRVLRR